MKLGFTLDEKELKNISVEEWLTKSKALGASSIEISPDVEILSLSTYVDIAKTASNLGFEINYHIPYFASEHYSIESFLNYSKQSKSKYGSFLSIIESISSAIGSSDSVIVIHGESFSSSSEKSLDGTVEFLQYLSSSLSERGLSHRLALETLRLGGAEKAGNSRSEAMEVLKRAGDPRIGLCLDICHDMLNYFPGKPPADEDFYSSVIYSHIHGFDFSTGKNHIGVLSSQLNVIEQALVLKKIKPDMTLSIESLSDFIGSSYLEELFLDISFMSSII